MKKITIKDVLLYTAPNKKNNSDDKMIMLNFETEDGLLFTKDYTYTFTIDSRLPQILGAIYGMNVRLVYSRFHDANFEELLVGKTFMADFGEHKENPITGKRKGYYICNMQPISEEKENLN